MPTQVDTFPLTRQQLIELWTLITSEPPPVVHDEATMVGLLEDELAKRREATPRPEPRSFEG